MKSIVRDGRFWACALLFAGLLGLILYFEHIDRYHPFPYILVVHALTVFSCLAGLYSWWSGRWKRGDGRTWGGWVLLCGLLCQLPMCGVSGVSWVMLGACLVMGLGALLFSKG
ncbi:hypothetical protein AALA83_01070 [Oscillospiraceae bacterium 44-5]